MPLVDAFRPPSPGIAAQQQQHRKARRTRIIAEPVGIAEGVGPAGAAEPPRSRSSGRAAAQAQMSPGPQNRPQVTKDPQPREGRGTTSDSAAIAATMPSCRSALSRWRVPNGMVKAGGKRQRDQQGPVLPPDRQRSGIAASGQQSIADETAFNCSAI